MRFVVDEELAAFVDDFSFDSSFDDDLRTRLDCQVGQKISADVQGAVLLNDRVVDNGGVDVRRGRSESQPFCGFLF